MLVFLFLSCLSLAQALYLAAPTRRDVFNPTITSPNASSVWPIGSKQFVEWKTDNIPPPETITNSKGKIVLGHLGSTGGLNLDLDHPLAANFSYTIGQVEITVPQVPPRTDYIVVLFGDSGNTSPAFAITQITGGGGGNGGSSSSASASSSISPPASPSPALTSSPSLTSTTTPADLSASITTALAQLTATSGSPSPSTSPATTTITSSSSQARYTLSQFTVFIASVATALNFLA